ncbi:MAG: hypothetical protein AUG51_04705 [Acidobacteria bacterium 13_1_20CM_3_53_8]|nr:MAG: hypothetical protein AUG51_04705 [Acidobacteria bacterium 13_1_20CM_3_53_8]
MNKQTLFRTSTGLSSELIIGLALALSLLTAFTSHSADSWVHPILPGTRACEDIKLEVLMLESVSKWGEKGHMSGTCTYYNFSPALVAIEGVETSGGDFYPSVTNQVANDPKGKWEIIKRSVPPGKAATTKVQAKARSKPLTLDLDAFVAMMGKFKYGRVVLKTGDSAIFDLDYLRPPPSAIK